MVQTVAITRPDDWHVHFRDEDMLVNTVPATARHFSRALVMPNLKPALTSLANLLSYRERILASLKKGQEFSPFMTFYLNEAVNIEDLQQATQYPYILGAKLYPAGATTNSEQGVRSLEALYPFFEIMQANNFALQIHGEVTSGDIFQREAAFLDECLKPIIHAFPKLRVILEHISTAAAVEFISQAPANVAATITPHHLLYHRNHLLAGGIKPHYYCLPILKHEQDQKALQKAATSGNPKFFAGTDSAPHPQKLKESACGCAGIYSAPYAVSLYAQVFADLGKLDKLEAFMSHFGANFYQLPLNSGRLELIKKPQIIPERLPLGDDYVIPVAAGEQIDWSVHELA
ncbi:dihydroorotase [Legionella septentrionalis]|nr:dihydroorotase [Legionella septentrionalis]